jgi:hypothetical protein
MLERFKLYIVVVGCAALLVTLTGCLAVPIVAMVATGGFTVLKTAQNTTAGKNTITLEEPSIEDTNALLPGFGQAWH